MSPSQRTHLMIFKFIKTDLSKVCGSFVMTFDLTNKNARIKLESEVISTNHAPPPPTPATQHLYQAYVSVV